MRLYSLGEVCALFAIDPVTLRRWMHRANITPHVDPSDHRRRYLDQAQLLALAQLHQRVLLASPQDASSSLPLAHLRQEITDLVRRIERLEAGQCRCCAVNKEIPLFERRSDCSLPDGPALKKKLSSRRVNKCSTVSLLGDVYTEFLVSGITSRVFGEIL